MLFSDRTVDIPQKAKYNENSLGKWLYSQKVKAKEGLLSHEQMRLLLDCITKYAMYFYGIHETTCRHFVTRVV